VEAAAIDIPSIEDTSVTSEHISFQLPSPRELARFLVGNDMKVLLPLKTVISFTNMTIGIALSTKVNSIVRIVDIGNGTTIYDHY
jgi:hypothetical protein